MTKQRTKTLGFGRIALVVIIGFVLLGSVITSNDLVDLAKRQVIDKKYDLYKKEFPKVRDFSAEEVLELMHNHPILFVDVREREEQEVSMLPEAISHREFVKDQEAYKDHIVIFYCTISYRSGKLAQRLDRQGTHIYNLRGGLLAWLHAGGKVYKHGDPVKRVHVYDKNWDLAPSLYETLF